MARISQLETSLRELTTRSHSLQLATVTAIDPNTRRIRVSRENQGDIAQTDWIQAGRSTSFADEPLPPIGTTVLIGYCEGNPHDGYYLRSFANATNPPDPTQQQPENDNTIVIPGNERRTVAGMQYDGVTGDRTIETGTGTNGALTVTTEGAVQVESTTESIDVTALSPEGKVTIMGFQSVKLSDAFGASIEIANGLITIQDSLGRKIVMGGGSWQFDLNGGTINYLNAGNVTINGKSVATVDALDSRGDTLITRGWT